MNEINANEKPRKKVIKKRKIFSAPNLPIDEMRVKTTDMFLVSPEDIRKYQKEMGMKIGEDKPKKPKTAKKVKGKKNNAKEVGKSLMEPTKPTSEEKQLAEDYQWLIKKNIIKLMGAAKKRAQKEAMKKRDNKLKPNINKFVLQKTKSESAKENKREQQRLTQLAKLDEQKPPLRPRKKTAIPQTLKNEPLQLEKKEKDFKREIMKARANTASIPRQIERMPKQRAQTSTTIHHVDYFTPPKGPGALILHPDVNTGHQSMKKSSMQKLKSLFNVFKSTPESASPKLKNKQLDLRLNDLQSSAGINLHAELMKAAQEGKKKKAPKKSNKIPEKIIAPQDPSSTIKIEKAKTKKKAPVKNDLANLKILPSINVPSATLKPVQEKKKKFSAQKLLQPVST